MDRDQYQEEADAEETGWDVRHEIRDESNFDDDFEERLTHSSISECIYSNR